MENCEALYECLACGNDELELTLNLGDQPLANNFLSKPGQNKFYPLAVNRCTRCYHLQLTHVVDPAIIYKNYAYVSGTSQTYVDYMRWFADWTEEYRGRSRGRVLDIGCNDGTQLHFFGLKGFMTTGVDPAENLQNINRRKFDERILGFWDEETVAKIGNKKFDIVVAQNAFAHNPNPLKYLQLLKPLMQDDGLFFIQTSQSEMVQNGEFDTIYHEHVNFYNVESMEQLCLRAGWFLYDVVKTPIHGKSYVFVLSTTKFAPRHIMNAKRLESVLYHDETYTAWAYRAHEIAKEYDTAINDLQSKGYTLVGYGAAAKGNTFLNYVNTTLDIIIDDNELKQNTYSPGKDIPVVSMKSAMQQIKDKTKVAFVPLAWNVFDEIKKKIVKSRNNSTDLFVRYFPEVKIETTS
jgi:2-polyprenyl-3-methyl-5-hydroxy-6-metoxy-1,4-benzoquinol methylase